MASPKQAFGGDDDTSGQQPQPPPAKKPDLAKYASKPDANIRDLFWEILAAYAQKKAFTGDELKPLAHERIALVRIALHILENPQKQYFGLGKSPTALYSLMLLLDGGWDDAVHEFVAASYYEDEKPVPALVAALNRVCKDEKYIVQIKGIFKELLHGRDATAALAYLSKTDNKELLLEMKKEIMIIARSDIEKNQYYAMTALARIMDDESRNMLAGLLSHWDVETRRNAADILKNEKDETVSAAAKRQLAIESDPSIKKLLAKLSREERNNEK